MLRAGGNCSGADAVMTWQTGYPASVDFTLGYPRYRPYDGSAAERLVRGDVDALLVVGAAARIPQPLLTLMTRVRRVLVGPGASDSALEQGEAPAMVIDTGVAGIHDGGTAMRMDDVPLPLRPSIAGPPGTADVVRALGALVRSPREVHAR